MAVRITTEEASLNFDVGYQRTCWSCGRPYAGLFYFSLRASRRDSGAKEALSGYANKVVKSVFAQLQRGERGSRCPKCRAIDPASQGSLPTQNAADLISSRFRSYVIRDLVWMSVAAAFVIFCVVAGVGAVYYVDTPVGTNPLPAMLTALGSLVVYAFLVYWYWYARLRICREEVDALSPEEAEAVLDVLYSESAEDLRLWALAGNMIGAKRLASPWLPAVDAFGDDLSHLYPPEPLLKGSAVKCLRQAVDFAKDRASMYAGGKRFPQPPETMRKSGGPGRWNWFYGHGVMLLSRTPASKESEHVLTKVIQTLHSLDAQNRIASSTVVTVRMNPSTRQWGVLIVHPLPSNDKPFQNELDEIIAEMDHVPSPEDHPLPLPALENLHDFVRVYVHPPQVYEWVKTCSNQVVAPIEFSDEQRTLVV